ncbi:hypothetical protein C5I_0103630 [Pseudomonas syringae pv. syringae FF5]|nr:hypothetical protein C5I_0103630 [Pseudomonas syringae pv. syringae FF5]
MPEFDRSFKNTRKRRREASNRLRPTYLFATARPRIAQLDEQFGSTDGNDQRVLSRQVLLKAHLEETLRRVDARAKK